MVEVLGMIFDTEAPNFGSLSKDKDNEYSLLATDIPKLNSMFTRAELGSKFRVDSGAVALVVDAKKLYMYNAVSDTWYEWKEAEDNIEATDNEVEGSNQNEVNGVENNNEPGSNENEVDNNEPVSNENEVENNEPETDNNEPET